MAIDYIHRDRAARARAMANHPAGKGRKCPTPVTPVNEFGIPTVEIEYPVINRVGIHPSQEIMRHAMGGGMVTVIHDHSAKYFPRMNCTNCL